MIVNRSKMVDSELNSVKKSFPTILVAEDEELNWQFLEYFLKGIGATVVIVGNGLKALEYVTNGNNVDLILMDIRMPVMDGIEATKKIKDFTPNIPVIAQTAYAMSDEERSYKKNGFDDLITKPIDPELLIKKVNFWLKK